jgi:hypothetical protein
MAWLRDRLSWHIAGGGEPARARGTHTALMATQPVSDNLRSASPRILRCDQSSRSNAAASIPNRQQWPFLTKTPPLAYVRWNRSRVENCMTRKATGKLASHEGAAGDWPGRAKSLARMSQSRTRIMSLAPDIVEAIVRARSRMGSACGSCVPGCRCAGGWHGHAMLHGHGCSMQLTGGADPACVGMLLQRRRSMAPGQSQQQQRHGTG